MSGRDRSQVYINTQRSTCAPDYVLTKKKKNWQKFEEQEIKLPKNVCLSDSQ